ncbi:amidohydrolase [Ensifer adhaerens]|uniref:amidohydrolase n=1 Tax=Ensifer adhaerens TaxID=106592 RepID=UPI001CBADE78|nr:amidohydrolase [Ensifer adhaerens]MBZ7925555.1 amidohydrolase [Ensifer adhaerens]UAX95291.1 amidohydrolase [Ensifer adhaerens]UAY02817.1 amidohydrolase [Ensifer adhaerens]UAY10801.1 amidohydrolase [Ensifer adhaerens]
MIRRFSTFCLAAAQLAVFTQPSLANDRADLVLRNGTIVTMDEVRPAAEALAIANGRIVAVGSDEEIEKLVQPDTEVLDLGGRTVIPGLVDTHIHAIRGGQTYPFETYWHDQTSLASALEALKTAARDRARDQWVAVVGSWHPDQFAERRPPELADLDKALPDTPAYVQYLYDYALVNIKGIELLALDSPTPKLPPGVRVERNGENRATGKLFGNIGSFNVLFGQLSAIGKEERKANLKVFFSHLNAAGVTGFIDPSAGPAAGYEPFFALRDEGGLTLRAGYRIPASHPGKEAEWFREIMSFRPAVHDDGTLSFLGIGESLVFAMNDGVQMGPGFAPPKEARDELLKVALFAAERHIPVEIHAYTDDAASAILDVFEEVHKTHPLNDLRWSIAHLNTGSERTLDRMQKMGLAYTVQMGPYFEAPAIREANGAAVAALSPPTRLAIDKGIMVAGGTDSTRIGVAGVWQAIKYHLTGRSLGGTVQKADDQLLTREDALRLYTRNAAWIGFAEEDRGTLSTGKFADLAVIDKPYMTMPVDEVDTVRSVLTLLGGKIVYDSGVVETGRP